MKAACKSGLENLIEQAPCGFKVPLSSKMSCFPKFKISRRFRRNSNFQDMNLKTWDFDEKIFKFWAFNYSIICKLNIFDYIMIFKNLVNSQKSFLIYERKMKIEFRDQFFSRRGFFFSKILISTKGLKMKFKDTYEKLEVDPTIKFLTRSI